MQQEPLIVYEQKDHYGILTINRAKKHNAISPPMAQQMYKILDAIKDEPLKFLVLQSSGNTTFCAGGDLNDYHTELDETEAYNVLHEMKQVLMQLVTFPALTICLLQGNAYGGGCELATACDIRIAKESTQFGFIQSNLGILPGWGGGAILYEKVHPSFAYHWLTAGSIYDAKTLADKGWIHVVVRQDEWEEMRQLKDYTRKSIEQFRHLKSQYIESLSVPTLLEKMEKESGRCASLWGSTEHKKALQQFYKKEN
ncbi:MAG TPA: enoyl-CoA hydratase/isomerase family protein [Pseudogracilibacillus sp.]|nr:enoyl-CoA hydratase/isomerase family protein [Pseudogracilibacillus sp.]